MNQVIVSNSPHKKTSLTTRSIMLDVIIALLPAAIIGCVYFGWKAIVVLALTVATSVATEFVWLLCLHKSPKDFIQQFDFTSVVTGLLLGMCFSAEVKWYVCILSAIFSVGIVKMLFGGTGKNIVNPAITGRIFAFISFSAIMSTWSYPNFSEKAGAIVSGATTLQGFLETGYCSTNWFNLFFGIGMAGCIGEVCKAALLLGYIYLVVRKVLDWKWPLIYIIVTGIVSVIMQMILFPYLDYDFYEITDVFLTSILSGGLFLGAIYMATDYVTSPKTFYANLVYYIVLGIITGIMRYIWKIEVVSFCILLMNLVVPLLDRYIRPKPFGYKKINPKKSVKSVKEVK